MHEQDYWDLRHLSPLKPGRTRELPIRDRTLLPGARISDNRVGAMMQVTIEVPEDIASQFAGDLSGLSRAATEALAMEGVRSGKLSSGQARRMLGFRTRMQVEAFLKERGVYFPITAQDVENDAGLSRTFREQWPSSQTPHR